MGAYDFPVGQPPNGVPDEARTPCKAGGKVTVGENTGSYITVWETPLSIVVEVVVAGNRGYLQCVISSEELFAAGVRSLPRWQAHAVYELLLLTRREVPPRVASDVR